jgi:hypothetical protein
MPIKIADAIVVIGQNQQLGDNSLIELFTEAQEKLFQAKTVPITEALDFQANNYLAFCGIGDPDRFFSLLTSIGYNLAQTRIFPDHYNYETLEFAFQLNFSRPETIPFSAEALNWANSQDIKLVAEQIPIANIIDLENNLVEYRKMLYRNSRDNNRVKIVLN